MAYGLDHILCTGGVKIMIAIERTFHGEVCGADDTIRAGTTQKPA